MYLCPYLVNWITSVDLQMVNYLWMADIALVFKGALQMSNRSFLVVNLHHHFSWLNGYEMFCASQLRLKICDKLAYSAETNHCPHKYYQERLLVGLKAKEKRMVMRLKFLNELNYVWRYIEIFSHSSTKTDAWNISFLGTTLRWRWWTHTQTLSQRIDIFSCMYCASTLTFWSINNGSCFMNFINKQAYTGREFFPNKFNKIKNF